MALREPSTGVTRILRPGFDTVLKADNVEIECIREILTTSSGYFLSQFSSEPSDRNIVLVNDVYNPAFVNVIADMHGDALEINQQNVKDILDISSRLIYEKGEKACLDFIKNTILLTKINELLQLPHLRESVQKELKSMLCFQLSLEYWKFNPTASFSNFEIQTYPARFHSKFMNAGIGYLTARDGCDQRALTNTFSDATYDFKLDVDIIKKLLFGTSLNEVTSREEESDEPLAKRAKSPKKLLNMWINCTVIEENKFHHKSALFSFDPSSNQWTSTNKCSLNTLNVKVAVNKVEQFCLSAKFQKDQVAANLFKMRSRDSLKWRKCKAPPIRTHYFELVALNHTVYLFNTGSCEPFRPNHYTVMKEKLGEKWIFKDVYERDTEDSDTESPFPLNVLDSDEDGSGYSSDDSIPCHGFHNNSDEFESVPPSLVVRRESGGNAFAYACGVNQWLKVREPTAIGCFGALHECVYACGGNRTKQNTVQFYDDRDVVGWRNGPPLAFGRCHAASGVLGGKLYVAGGEGCLELERFDRVASKWETLSPMPQFMSNHMLVPCRGKLYAFGGYNNLNGFSYDPTTNSWMEVVSPKDKIARCIRKPGCSYASAFLSCAYEIIKG